MSPQQSMLNEFDIPVNGVRRRMSDEGFDVTATAPHHNPWSIWNSNTPNSVSNPGSVVGDGVEQQQQAPHLHHPWRRKNSAVTDPVHPVHATTPSAAAFNNGNNNGSTSNNGHVFRSSSFSGGMQPLTASLRNQTSPRFFHPQPNIAERYSSVIDATREAELLGSGLAQVDLNSSGLPPTTAPTNPRSEVASPTNNAVPINNSSSPYISPTPTYANLAAGGDAQSSRSNSMSSLWRPQPFEPVAGSAAAAPIPVPSFQPVNDYADFISNPAEYSRNQRKNSANVTAAAAAAHAAFMNPTSPTNANNNNNNPASSRNGAAASSSSPFRQQQFQHSRYPSKGGGGGVQSPPRKQPPTTTAASPGSLDKDMANIRSPLLEEFRTNKNRKYDLRDLYGHIVEFSGDQHGSRFIQQRLESATSEEKEVIFNEIRPNSLQLMTDVFGNYVIQKFFELGNQPQKTMLAKQMESHILNLSLQMYGCRVVQKAVEHVLTDQQAALIKELDGHVLKCVKDQNGNHVIQKAIERIPSEHITFILDSFKDQVYQLATHPYGCRVIQRMLEHSDEQAKRELLNELHLHTFSLVEDQYGNYVIQHVVQRGNPEDRNKIIEIVKDSLLTFSRHKYASNVVEKCIAHGTAAQRDELLNEILKPKPDGSLPITIMMRDQFANYVIQKMLDVTHGDQRERLVETIKPQLQTLKKFTYGKHLVSIERLMQLSQGNDDQHSNN